MLVEIRVGQIGGVECDLVTFCKPTTIKTLREDFQHAKCNRAHHCRELFAALCRLLPELCRDCGRIKMREHHVQTPRHIRVNLHVSIAILVSPHAQRASVCAHPFARLVVALVKQVTPFKQLTTASYSSVWLKSTTRDGNLIHARTVPQGEVREEKNPSAPFVVLVNLLKDILAGATTIDVSIGGHEFCITQLTIVGGVEYAVTSRANIPPAAHSEISVSI